MPTLHLTTFIAAPPDRVFDLARSIDLHSHSAADTGERAVAGVTSGLLGLGQEVTWQARHFGVKQHLSVRMTECDRPHAFADEMLRGAFASMKHRHSFAPVTGGTRMDDELVFTSPLGWLGRLADVLFLEAHMRKFLLKRNQILKAVAESDEWKKYV